MRGASSRRRFRAPIIILSVMTMLLVTSGNAAATKPRTNCPPGFDVGLRPIVQVDTPFGSLLPNIQLGIDDGFYDQAFVVEREASLDRNDDGMLCYQTYPANASSSSLLQYFYNVADNNASVPTG